ncbi:MAG TPA: DinB family protein [Terriglobales bacterium]
MAKAEPQAFVLAEALIHAFDTNERINQFMLENLPAGAWRAAPPEGKGREIAAIAAHMHNVRVMWLKATKSADIPEQLDRHTVTVAQARKGLEQSRKALSGVLKSSLEANGQVKGFKPDVAGFVGYLIAHDAHHRGQICMLARQAGHPLPQKGMFGMWEWGSRGKE